MHAGTCGVGESFLLESGVPYMFSDICKRYSKLLPADEWLDVRSSAVLLSVTHARLSSCGAKLKLIYSTLDYPRDRMLFST